MEFVALMGEQAAEAFSSSLASLPRRVHYGHDAALNLARSLSDECDGRRVAVLFDQRTRQAAGAAALQALRDAGWSVQECLVADRENGKSPVCDDLTKDALQRDLPQVDAFVAVGSGVINDLTKWLAAEAGAPYGVFATAASMNGYAAANVAPTIGGVKSLFRAKAPRVIAADPRVLAKAPHTLTASGLGDLVAKPVSTADWRMNHLLFGEPYSEAIAALIDRVEPMYLDDPAAVARHEPAALRGLFEALVLSGSAMTLQGSSLPASGGEHLISHTLDMSTEVDGVEHDLHGRQVGVATILVAALYEAMLAVDQPRFTAPTVGFDPSPWGASANTVKAEFDKKKTAMTAACEKLSEPGMWDAVRAAIAPSMRKPARIKQCLTDAGAAHRIEDIHCSRERFLRAVRACSWMRGRFTSVDLAVCMGLIPGIEDGLVDRLLS